MVNRKVIQLGIAMVGVIIAFLLFSLPKFVVENNEDQLSQTEAEENQANEPEIIEEDNAHLSSMTSIDDERIAYFRKKIVDNSDNPEDFLIFADSLTKEFEKGFVYDSVAHYRELIYSKQESLANQIKLANAYFEVFQYTPSDGRRKEYALKAKGLYENILTQSSSEDVKTRLAVTKVYAVQPPMVGIGELKGLIEENPDNVSARLYLSEFMLTVQRLESAEEQLKEILKREPENLKANLLLAECLIGLNKKLDAEEQIARIKSLNQQNDPYIEQFVQEKLDIIKSL